MLAERREKRKKRLSASMLCLRESNSTTSQHLRRFEELHMRGQEATYALLSLISPVDPTSFEDKLNILKTNGTKPDSLYDQVSWIYKKGCHPNRNKMRAILDLNEKTLESLEKNENLRKIHSKEYGLTDQVKERTRNIRLAYRESLKLIDESSPGHSRLIFSILGLLGLLTTGGVALLSKNNAHIDVEVNPTSYLSQAIEFEVDPTHIPSTATSNLNYFDTITTPPPPNLKGNGPFDMFDVAKIINWYNPSTKRWQIIQLKQAGEEGYFTYTGPCRYCGEVAGFYHVKVPKGTLIEVWDGNKMIMIPAPEGIVQYYRIGTTP